MEPNAELAGATGLDERGISAGSCAAETPTGTNSESAQAPPSPVALQPDMQQDDHRTNDSDVHIRKPTASPPTVGRSNLANDAAGAPASSEGIAATSLVEGGSSAADLN